MGVCKIISSGSHGNAVLLHDSILFDIGVPFSKIKPYMHKIQIVLISHRHFDHININTLRKLQFERPSIRIGIGVHMLEMLNGLKNIDVYEAGKVYDYGGIQISPVILYHDVPCFGWRVFKGNHKTFFATDTYTLEGITAKNYDLFLVEHNYNEDTVRGVIEAHNACGEFSHERRSFNTHLSEQQARDFIFKNKGEKYEVLRLHESSGEI